MKTFRSFTMQGLKILLIVISIFLFADPANANVKLPGVLTSNMVIQRNKEIKVWGRADPGEKVSVSFNNKTMSAMTGKDGSWMLVFPAMKEGGPYTMVIRGKNSISLENILIGDIWVCSGQSNMEFAVVQAKNGQKEIANADFPTIRLLNVPRNLQYFPVDDIPGMEWQVCSPETAGYFSAVGYFFGKEIFKQVGVPVGLINSSWGGTEAEAWTSGDYLEQMDDFKNKPEDLVFKTPEQVKAEKQKFLEGLYSRFGLNPLAPPETGTWNQPGIDLSNWEEIDLPSLWETGGIGELDGVVWFRKEVNIPENLAGKEWTLNLGKIDDSDLTYINGQLVGETTGRYDANRVYPVKTGVLKPGKNLVAVKVIDTGGGGGIWGDKEDMKLVCPETEIPLDGTWMCRVTLESLIVNDRNNPNSVPSCLYNGMIYPLLNLAVKGAIWYQGEANANRAYQYRTLFPLMIESWRAKWNQPDLPFFFVQLANYLQPDDLPVQSDWAELREAQSMTLSLPNTGMAVIIDVGEADDIHPKNKQDVGYRLALQALKTVYGKDIVKDGPVYKSMDIEGNKAILTFDTEGSELVVKDKYGYLKGFAVAGEDQKFYWARAYVENGKVILFSDKVNKPVAVRYAWANNPDDANLYNTEGLPASPFRTDEWDGITRNNK